MIFLFDSPGITLGNAGGKGLNLARLCRAGLPVPPGFIIPTPAYQAYLQANSLEAVIQPAITTSDAQDPDALEAASAAIRAAFARGTVPPSLAEEILQGYTSLGAGAVAVRSSATAEDLPEMSFAGQQDTYLNIQGSAALLQAVIACWGSLWTARAISYRARNRLAPADLSLAVIVQQMVPAQSSGVLFTANPLSGLRSETVIDATLGLGEALVSGQVEPDQYTVQSQSNKITHKHIGAKATQTRIDSHGGVRSEQVDSHDVQALADDRILELARLGQHVAALFGEPQDIEWAWADGKLYLLQARPITSLFPTPQGMPADPLRVLFSFGAVQGMLDPVTPFGQDFLRRIFTVGSHLFAIPVTLETQTVMFTAGERLWINITTPLRNTFGRKIIRPVLNMGDPAAVEALNAIWDDPRLQPQRRGIRFHARTQIARFLVPVLGNVLLNLISPDQRREYIVNRGERVLQVVRERCAALQGDRRARLTQLTQLVPDLLNQYLPRTFRLFISGIAAGMVSLNVLSTASQHAGPGTQDGQKVGWSDLILKVAGGIPNNPTTEMDLALWQTAQLIKKDPLS
ncbi:MAG TPA: PEP/pyruvate-binding domain-containing protein, partial [Anaerolineaceae bacterium]